ncbi:MAG: hypothetical protein P4L40_02235, partial [Terracidiphilus sp.]|nr:hypothetical protein [Terracidiphilus sp.]
MAENKVNYITACPTATQSLREVPAHLSQLQRVRRSTFAALALAIVLPASVLIQGCGSSSGVSLSASSQASTSATLNPTSASVQVWQNLQFSVSGAETTSCSWSTSAPATLSSIGNGEFQATQTGTAKVTVTCGSSTATANVVVSAQQQSAPITITSGGTYSGNWVSNDPSTPAVTIKTDEPVIIQDSVISSRGDLISITGVKTGANVTVENVTGTALDPQVSGKARGSFIKANKVAS